MGTLFSSMRVWLRRKAREEDGAATIPFVIFVPFFMVLIMSSLEEGTLMLRHVMLERALDLSVRDLRLDIWEGGTGPNGQPTHSEFKKAVCDRAGVIPDCENVLLVNLVKVSTSTWSIPTFSQTCVDRGNLLTPAKNIFTPGSGDEMMLVLACAKFDPIFPTSGLGFQLTKDNTGAYALTSASAFVNEPELGG